MLVGFMAPILRSVVLGMPQMFPTAFCMAFELATYGLVSGVLYKRFPQKKWCIYASLILAMIAGRIVWGIAMFTCLGFDTSKFGFSAFLAGAVINALPGIILQLVLIPLVVIALQKVIRK